MKQLTQFDNQYAINPQLIITIAWTSGDVSYAMDEMGDVYGYVQEFSNLSLVQHSSGFGQVNSVNVIMFDAFGHFKKMFEGNNIYLTEATISVRNLVDETTTQLFVGQIEEPEWDQEGKEFSFAVLSKPLKGTVGYTPDIEDISSGDTLYGFYVEHLSGEPWPSVFGSVTNMKAVRLNDIPNSIKTTEDTILGTTDDPLTDFEGSISVDRDFSSVYSDNVSGFIFNKEEVLAVTGTFGTSDFTVSLMTDVLWTGAIVGTLVANTWVIRKITLASLPDIPMKNMIATFEIVWTTSMLSFHFDIAVSRVEGLILFFDDPQFTNIQSKIDSITLIKAKIRTQQVEDYILPAGSTFYISDQTNYDIYVVDAKEGTTVSAVKVEIEDGIYETLVESTDYYVHSTTDETGGQKFWAPQTHPDCTYIEMAGSSFFKYYRDFLSDTGVKESILVDCTNDYNTEQDTITYLALQLGLTTTFYGPTNKDTAWAIMDEESIPELISDIAWQGFKSIRINDTSIEVFDLYQNPAEMPVIPFVDSIELNHIQYNQFKITSSPFDELVTKLDFTYTLQDQSAETETKSFKSNVALYETREHAVDVFIFKNETDVTVSGDLWIERLSNPEYMIILSGAMNLMKYEVWDKLVIYTPRHIFANEAPIDITSGPDGMWNITEVIVKEVAVNFTDLSVTLTLRSNIILGTL